MIIDQPAQKELVFDYHYNEGFKGDTSRQTVYMFVGYPLTLTPRFQLDAKVEMRRLFKSRKWPQINLDEYPKFSRHYRLHSEDASGIERDFTPEVIQFFAHRPGWQVETYHGILVCYKPHDRPNPDNLDYFVKEAREIVQLLAEGPIKAYGQ